MKQKILFISHEASYTGAPIVLRNFLRYFDKRGLWEKHILILDTGPLCQEFATLAFTFFIDKISRSVTDFSGVTISPNIDSFLLRQSYKLIYSNTVANGPIIQAANKYNIPVIIHVHETENLFKKYTKFAGEFLEDTLKAKHFICVSKIVKEYLQQNYFVPQSKLSIVSNGVDSDELDRLAKEKSPDIIKKELNIPLNSTIIGGVGSVGLHKGVDIWLQIARRIYVQSSVINPFFLWVGAIDNRYAEEMIRDIELIGLINRVFFIGSVSNPYPYINTMDLLISSSRFESFGLANLEAQYLGKPIICSKASGGAHEIISPLTGIVTEFLDVVDMANAALTLLHDQRMYLEKSIVARKIVLDKFLIDNNIERIEQIIENIQVNHSI